MLTREPLDDGAFALAKGSSRTVFRELAPGIVLIVATGPGEEALDAAVLQELSRSIERHGPLTIFADLSKLGGIGLGSSRSAVRWVRRHRQAIRAGHLLVGHTAVSIAVSMIASVFAGSVR